MYIAHYDHKKQNKSHSLKDHVNEMLMIIQNFNLDFDLYGIIKASIILHDVGKKSNAFQEYIKKKDQVRGTVQHAIGGAYVLNQYNDELEQKQRYVSNIIQLIVASHHVGLFDYNKSFFDKMNALPNELSGIERLATTEVSRALKGIDVEYFDKVSRKLCVKDFKLYISMLIRFSLSALVDADYLSTEAFFSQKKAIQRQYVAKDFVNYKSMFNQYYEENYTKREKSNLNYIRLEIQQKASNAGQEKHTFYTLHAPTGSGKTLAAIKFALKHAKTYKKDRIITALPLINLTEEITNIYKDIFGKNEVIEDHSNTLTTDHEDGKRRLIAENWDRPFVITTTVQLFESLFHNRPMKLRKLHRIQNSIIIIDEYHQLPLHLLEPILKSLDILQTQFNVTVLFVSATPLPLTDSKEIRDMSLLNHPKNIVKDQKIYNKLPKRICFEWLDKPLCQKELINNIITEGSILVIVNTRKEAQELFQSLLKEESPFDYIFHLSTTMCGYHRNCVINKIKEKRRKNNCRIAVISTSVMEVGIDISFPVVYRMLAPLESIIQAAGRCNRNNEIALGQVVLFEYEQVSKMDKFFQAGVEQVRHILNKYGTDKLLNAEIFLSYYKRTLNTAELNRIDFNEENFKNFQEISKQFKMIEDNRKTVICSSAPGFKEEWLEENITNQWWRKIQPFTVSIGKKYSKHLEKEDGMIWTGPYDKNVGIKL